MAYWLFGCPRTLGLHLGIFVDDLGEHFGGLGGSWEQIGISMYSGISPGGPQIEVTRSGKDEWSVPGA